MLMLYLFLLLYVHDELQRWVRLALEKNIARNVNLPPNSAYILSSQSALKVAAPLSVHLSHVHQPLHPPHTNYERLRRGAVFFVGLFRRLDQSETL